MSAAQFTATNLLFGPCLSMCIALAASSLPVPVSPTMRTGLHALFATSRIIFRALAIAGLFPTIETDEGQSSEKKRLSCLASEEDGFCILSMMPPRRLISD